MANNTHNNRIKIARKMRGLGPRYRSAVYAKRSRRYAARMRELTPSNGWLAPLRGTNQPFGRQNFQHNQSLRAHYVGNFAGQLAHYLEEL